MELELWLDVICPWCFLGKRRFEAALARFEHSDEVTVALRAFELDPSAPRVREGSLVENLAAKYGIAVEEARSRQAQLVALGAEAGIAFDFERARSGSTFDAHRLIKLGEAEAEAGGAAVAERLMRGYFSEGLAIGDPDALAGVAVEAGLDADEVRALLAGQRFAEEVRDDEERGAALGIRGVPFLVLDGRYGLSGAQPEDAFLQALEHAWGERAAV